MFSRMSLGAILLGISWMAAAAPPMTAPEEGIEASTRDLAPPDDSAGSIVARQCSTCPQVLLRLHGQSKYFVGRTEVDFKTLTKYWRESGPRSLGIFYDRRALTVSRLVLDGELPK